MNESLLHSAKNTLYRGPIKTGCEYVGLDQLLSPLYDLTIKYAGPDTVTYTAGHASADFHVKTSTDLNRHGSPLKEHKIIEDIVSSLSPSDVFYDIGANLGTYTCLAGDVVNRVVAFEPHPAMADRLRENLILNDIDASVQELAVSDTDGEANFMMGTGRGPASASLVSTIGGESIHVKTAAIDSLVAEETIQPPDVMKIDAEGAEEAVVRGLSNTLQTSPCRLIYCEIHPTRLSDAGESSSKIESALKEKGFDVEQVDIPDRTEYFLKAVR